MNTIRGFKLFYLYYVFYYLQSELVKEEFCGESTFQVFLQQLPLC